MFGFFDGGMPQPGTPAPGGSTGYLQGISQDSGIPIGGQPQASQGLDFFPYLYTGTKHTPATGTLPGNPEAKSAGTYADTKNSVLDAQTRFSNSGNDNIHHWAYLLALAGYKGDMTPQQAAEYAKGSTLNDVLDMHLNFLKDAANLYGMGQKITPNQYLKKLLDFRLGDGWDGKFSSLTPDKADALGSGITPKTTTQTTRSVDLMSNEDAKGLVRGMLQQELGRDPTQAEYEDFVATLHSAQRANPSVSTSTVTTDGNGNGTQTVRSSGGLSDAGINQALYEHLRQQPTWAEWQAVGTYAPALFEALGAAVPGA